MTSDRPSRRHRLTEPDMLIGISAVLIGVCALFVSVHETRIMRDDQRLSVLPMLELSRSYYRGKNPDSADNLELLFAAENVGIGPARIEGFYVRVDDKTHANWGSALRALLETDDEIKYGQSTINHRTIPAGGNVVMFSLNDTQYSAAIIENFQRLDFAACFCSVFRECWVTSYQEFGVIESVADCPANGQAFAE